jgi:formate-dependent phosphoribosylglycinamide formyltransferase (GAR transformylase)
MMKSYLRQRGISLLPYLDPCEKSLSVEAIIGQLGCPVVVKATNLSGRQGLVFAGSAADLIPYLPVDSSVWLREETAAGADVSTTELVNGQRRTSNVLFEQYIDATEVSVESLVSDGETLFSNVTEYVDKTWVNLVPGRLVDSVHNELLKLNQTVIRQIGIDWGMTHAEYFIANGQLYFGEIALRPPGGYLMDLISLAYEFDAWDCFVANELQLPVENLRQTANRSTASVLFHPGAGKLRSIEGVARVQADPNLEDLQFLRYAGQAIPERMRVSIAAAYAIFCGATAEEVLASVASARRELKFNLEPQTAGDQCDVAT